MTGNARINDIGIGRCPKHKRPRSYTTVFVTGAPTVLTNGLPTTVIGTIGIASCGHPTVALTGAGTVFTEGQGVHRLSDVGQNFGPYVVNTASGDVDSE